MDPHAPIERCPWCGTDPLYVAYHDQEWGVPLHQGEAVEARWFERLCLEAAQAGLSWITVLRKRAHYRQVFDDFDPRRVATYDDAKVAALLTDGGIIRNRAKIHAAISNANAFLRIQDEFGGFNAYIWRFVDGQPLQNQWARLSDLPAQTPLSQAISRDLLKRGLRFVGPTICYAMMQAGGLVNDHLVSCHRYLDVQRLGQIHVL
jgi:DNA-3-methyladenine glycosylase I